MVGPIQSMHCNAGCHPLYDAMQCDAIQYGGTAGSSAAGDRTLAPPAPIGEPVPGRPAVVLSGMPACPPRNSPGSLLVAGGTRRVVVLYQNGVVLGGRKARATSKGIHY